MSVRMFKVVFMCWWRVIVTVQLCNRYIGGGWKLLRCCNEVFCVCGGMGCRLGCLG